MLNSSVYRNIHPYFIQLKVSVNRSTYISVQPLIGRLPSVLLMGQVTVVTRYAYSEKFAISNNHISPCCIQVGLHRILQMRKSHVQLYCYHLVNVAKHCYHEMWTRLWILAKHECRRYLYTPVGSSDLKLTGNEFSGSIKCWKFVQ